MKKNILLFIFLGISVCVSSQDKDKDCVLDQYDECPEIKGLPSRKGCPFIIDKDASVNCTGVRELIGFEKVIAFDFNKFDFTDEAIRKLDTIVFVMKDYPNSNFTIEGFIDKEEKSKKNKYLSQKRAKVVFNNLVSKGISAKRISLIDDGEDDIVIDNKIFKGILNNKRVEISLDKRKE